MKRKRNQSLKRAAGESGSGGKTALIVFAGVLAAVAIGLTAYGALFPVKKQDNKSMTPSPSASSSPKSTSSATPSKSPAKSAAALDVKELKVQFNLPSSLHDLEYQVAKLPGDTEVTSVGFGSARLDAQGCAASTSPLGYLTTDGDQGGQFLATIKTEQYFYIEPKSSCASDEVTAESTDLKNALINLKTDGR